LGSLLSWLRANADGVSARQFKIENQRFKLEDENKFFILCAENDCFESKEVRAWFTLPTRKERREKYRSAVQELLTPPPENPNNNFQSRKSPSGDTGGKLLLEYLYKNTTPVKVVKGGTKDALFYDHLRKQVHEVEWDGFCALEPEVKVQRQILRDMHQVRVEYVPHEDFDFNEMIENWTPSELAVLNTYKAPEWRKQESPSPTLDLMLKAFLEHLFPQKVHRNYVLNWLFKSLHRPVEQHLVLIGAQNTGKSTLVTELFKNLHGFSNFTLLNPSALRDKFNSDLLDATLTLFDEAVVRRSMDLDTLKRWGDGQVSIERKGIDPEKKPRTTSLVFVANSYGSFKINPISSRKFGFPDLTDKPLSTLWSKSEIKAFLSKIADPEVLSNFYHWLKNNEETNSLDFATETHRGLHYQEAIIQASGPQIKSIIKTILSKNKESYTSSEVQERFFSKNMRNEENYIELPIEDLKILFDEYRHKGERIATVDVKNDLVIPTTNYQPDKSEMETDGI